MARRESRCFILGGRGLHYKNYRLLLRKLCSQTTELREYVQYNKTNIKKNIYIYYIQWLITKLSLNLLVLHTGAAKVRPDLRLYICWERVGSRWLSLWLPCAIFLNRSLHNVRLLLYRVGRPALAKPSL